MSVDRVKLEQFTNWLTQEIANSVTHSVPVKHVPARLNMCAAEVDEALALLRDRDIIACSNGRWWTRDVRAHRAPSVANQLTRAVVASTASKRRAR
jgi:hypothetical protein